MLSESIWVYYLNPWRRISEWNLSQVTTVSVQEYEFKVVVCATVAILYRLQHIKELKYIQTQYTIDCNGIVPTHHKRRGALLNGIIVTCETWNILIYNTSFTFKSERCVHVRRVVIIYFKYLGAMFRMKWNESPMLKIYKTKRAMYPEYHFIGSYQC